jgi:hypothetical protein
MVCVWGQMRLPPEGDRHRADTFSIVISGLRGTRRVEKCGTRLGGFPRQSRYILLIKLKFI